MKPTHEEKCQHKDISESYLNGVLMQKNCVDCGKDLRPSPSPEARVDWEQRAEELLENIMNFPLSYGLKEFVAGELKAAFEKGREAR